ncbi:cytochrome P450 CYP72A219 [Lactuca sativa]|uniref:cytochrome P450 CYP72A219 n=1 Tax=Lactuca sativa TaxID=4236 RepID=UPI000CD89DD8|nr:cytochrome P450 CYP72A219 [Lactuca sativa]
MELSKELYVAGVSLGVIIVLITWRILDLLWFKPKKIENFLRAQGLKGNSYRFLFGDLKEMTQMTRQAKSKPIDFKDDIVPRALPFVHKFVVAYGKICFAWMGRKPMVYVTEPAMVKEMLANYYEFQKSRGGNPLVRKLMKGVIDAEGDQWAKHRKIINPAFHMEKLRHMVPAFYICCNELVNKWEKMLSNESMCEIDVWPYLQTLSNDAISRTAFVSSFEEGRKIFELQHEMLELIIKYVQTAYIPGSSFLPTKLNKRLNEINQKVKASIKGIIDRRLVTIKARESSNDDLLEILLKSNNEEIEQEGKRNSGLSIEEIIEECKLFYVAGQETTRNLLVWTMALLGQHINWQERARDEILHIFKDKKPDFEGLSRLKVVNMIFNEVLRLYPPVTSLGRMVHKETKLGDITVPSGTLLHVSTILLHHDRDIWGDDVKEFNPERFSEGVLKVTKGQTCYLPFGGGPRICVGQNFAMLEAKMVLAMILQRFFFEISPSYSHAPHLVGTLQPQFGAHLILRKL